MSKEGKMATMNIRSVRARLVKKNKARSKALKAFWGRVHIKRNKNKCWQWTGSTNKKGQGLLQIAGKQTLAHRAAYKLFKGDIPSDKWVMPECNTVSCVNPDHHSLKSPEQAMRGKNPNGKLTLKDVKAIRKAWEAGKLTQQEIGDKYGVSKVAIWAIIHHRTWKEAK
jgi:hypothetical protein